MDSRLSTGQSVDVCIVFVSQDASGGPVSFLSFEYFVDRQNHHGSCPSQHFVFVLGFPGLNVGLALFYLSLPHGQQTEA